MVTLQKVRDEYGNGMDLGVYEDIKTFPLFDTPRKLESIKNFKYVDGDVIVCGFPKSGNHWISALVYLLLQMKTPDEIQTCQIPMMPFLDMMSTQKLAKRKVPRSFDSHMLFHRLPDDHVRNGGKIILIVRNPKDVAVSLYHHVKRMGYWSEKNEQSWGFFHKCFLNGDVLYGSYFDYLDSWQNVINVRKYRNILVVHYENLVKDCFGELQRIQRFVGLDRSDDILHQIVRRCSFKGLQHSMDDGKMSTLVVDKTGKSILFRKGRIGDWKTHFTVEQNEAFEKIASDRFRNSIFNFTYEDSLPKHRL